MFARKEKSRKHKQKFLQGEKQLHETLAGGKRAEGAG
jgi:hypothetical protein